MENIGITIPAGTRKEDIKAREKIIKDFYAKWISEHPEKKIWNENLQDYICVKYQSINETYNKAARRYESTLAVFRLTEVMEKAILKEEKKTKPDDKNQKPYSKLLIMLHDDIKLTVGVQKKHSGESAVLPDCTRFNVRQQIKNHCIAAVARLGARNRLSDKGCHPFYELPFDSAKVCIFC